MILQKLLYILMLIVFIFLYILAYIYLKPFLVNRKRKYSTIILKVSYLIYLAVLFLFVFLFLIFGADSIEYKMSDTMFFGILAFLFLPNIGILLRRKIIDIKRRILYNHWFTIINILAGYYLLHKLIENNWFL